jgi:DNA modification methylase
LLINGDCLVELAKLPDNSVDLIVTDPPYGYAFMGKEWDKALPDKRIWKECFRVLKHGGFSYIMSAPRQDVLSRMMINLEDSGFNIGFTSMYWAYATGFPKAMNMSKAIDKKLGVKRTEVIGSRTRNVKPYDDSNGWNDNNTKGEYEYKKPASEQAKKMDGSYAGFQPKPAVEVIIVCMKPLEEKGYIDQALANGKGVSWFDDCRIPSENNEHHRNTVAKAETGDDMVFKEGSSGFHKKFEPTNSDKGRYPANLLVSDDSLNDNIKHSSGKIEPHHKINHQNEVYGKYDGIEAEKQVTYGDSGSFSRYFDIDKWWESQFIITPKASKSEKNKGLDDFEEVNAGILHASTKGQLKDLRVKNPDYERKIPKMKNNHPTVKPLKLISYLITLGSREGDVILDPFMGSGTTPLASKQLNRKYIGIELDEDYFKICKARVEDC